MGPLILQPNRWVCGPTSLVNLMALRGRAIGLEASIRWTGATPEKGTPAAALKRALDWLKVPCVEYSSPGLRRSWGRLTRSSRPGLLSVDKDEHWVLLMSGVGRRILVWDPLVGLCVYGRAEFMSRWVSPVGRFYGLLTS